MKSLQELHKQLPIAIRILFMLAYLAVIILVLLTNVIHDKMIWLYQRPLFDGMVLISISIIVIWTELNFSDSPKKKVSNLKIGVFCFGLIVFLYSLFLLPDSEVYYREFANRNNYTEKKRVTSGVVISLDDYIKSQDAIKAKTIQLPYWKDSPFHHESLRTVMLLRDYFTSISEATYWEGDLYTESSSALIGYRGILVSTPYIKGYAHASKNDVVYSNKSMVPEGLPSIPLAYAIEVCRAQAWQFLPDDKKDKVLGVFLVKTKDTVLWVIIFPDLCFEFDSRKGTVDYIWEKNLDHNERKRRVGAM